jgi:hypothetical protein
MAAKESIQLPVLDISEPSPDTAKELINAVKNYGFVFISNNRPEVPVEDIDNMFALVSQQPISKNEPPLTATVKRVL